MRASRCSPSLREEHAVGVVVAVRGEIVWADLFADTDLLSRYWTKLVRSYAAESLTEGEDIAAADAWPMRSIFSMRPREARKPAKAMWASTAIANSRAASTETFVLESLLPGTGYDVHISKMKLITSEYRIKHPQVYR